MPEETVTGNVIDIESVDLSWDAHKTVVARPVLCRLDIDAVEPGLYGPQYHLGLHPMRDADPQKVWSSWLQIPMVDGSASSSERGQYGMTRKALQKVFGHDITGLGKGELVGMYGMFLIQDYSYYSKAKKQTVQGRPTFICVRKPTQEDFDEALNQQTSGASTAGTPNAESRPPTGALSDVDLGLALNWMAGKKRKDVTKGLGDSDLPVDVRNAIFGGQAKTQLMDAGLLDEVDGVYQATVTA